MMLSVIVPAYNEEQTAVWTAEKLGKMLSEAEIPYELIFVDDGSKDHTWQAIGLAIRWTRMCGACVFRAISARRRRFSQAWPMRRETARR